MDFLQYGALGLVTAVLVAVGVFVREYIRRAEEGRSENEQFIRQLVQDSLKSREDSLSDWKQITTETVVAMAQSTTVLQSLVASIDEHEGVVGQRYNKLRENHESLRRLMERILNKEE